MQVLLYEIIYIKNIWKDYVMIRLSQGDGIIMGCFIFILS